MTHDVFKAPEPQALSMGQLARRRAHLLHEIERVKGPPRTGLSDRFGLGITGPASRRRVVVLVVALFFVVVGGAVAVTVAIEPGGSPRLIGQRVEVAAGSGWSLVAWKSDHGICLDFTLSSNEARGCGFPVLGAPPDSANPGNGPRPRAIGYLSLGGADSNAAVAGPLADGVARVDVELSDGRVLNARTHDAPADLATDLRFFVLVFSLDSATNSKRIVRTLRAYDAEGVVVERYSPQQEVDDGKKVIH